MDPVYEILIHKVHDYDGTVNGFIGDGIMAMFGAPVQGIPENLLPLCRKEKQPIPGHSAALMLDLPVP